MKKIFVVDCGVLLNKENEDFNSYAVYDKKYGYYDEIQECYSSFSKAKEFVNDYVINGISTTYGIISVGYVKEEIKDNEVTNLVPWNIVDFSIDEIVYNICKSENKEIIKDFISKN